MPIFHFIDTNLPKFNTLFADSNPALDANDIVDAAADDSLSSLTLSKYIVSIYQNRQNQKFLINSFFGLIAIL